MPRYDDENNITREKRERTYQLQLRLEKDHEKEEEHPTLQLEPYSFALTELQLDRTHVVIPDVDTINNSRRLVTTPSGFGLKEILAVFFVGSGIPSKYDYSSDSSTLNGGDVAEDAIFRVGEALENAKFDPKTLENAFSATNTALLHTFNKYYGGDFVPEEDRISTSLVVGMLTKGVYEGDPAIHKYLSLASLGDITTYILRGQTIVRTTQDDTYRVYNDQTREPKIFLEKGLGHAAGTQISRENFWTKEIARGDTIATCTRGTQVLNMNSIASILLARSNKEKASERIVNDALLDKNRTCSYASTIVVKVKR